jgi:hypothetical protein
VFATVKGGAEKELLAAPAAVLAPDPIPWPVGLAPAWQPVTPEPADTDLHPVGDVLVVTYTVAEGKALADVLSLGHGTTGWTRYRNGWPALKGTVHGEAPSRGYDRAGRRYDGDPASLLASRMPLGRDRHLNRRVRC